MNKTKLKAALVVVLLIAGSGCTSLKSNRETMRAIDPVMVDVADDLIAIRHQKCGYVITDESLNNTIENDPMYPFLLSLKRIDHISKDGNYRIALNYAISNFNCNNERDVAKGIIDKMAMNPKFGIENLIGKNQDIISELKIRDKLKSEDVQVSLIPEHQTIVLY